MAPRSKKSRKRGIWALVVGFAAWLLDQLRQIDIPSPLVTIAVSLTIVIFVTNPLRPNPSPQDTAPDSPSVFPTEPGTPWEVDTATTHDNAGRRLSVVVGTMDVNHRWLLGSTLLIGIEGKGVPVEEVFSKLERDIGRPIVVLGMASHENATENPAQEDARALERADRLGALAKGFFDPHPEVRFVNLGARKSNLIEENSADERRVAIMQIACIDPGADIVSGIRNALRVLSEERHELPFSPADYQNWEPERFRAPVAAHRTDAPRVPPCSAPG